MTTINDLNSPPAMVNTNTYVSIGLIALVMGGIWAILGSISSTKNEIVAVRSEIVDAKKDTRIFYDKLDDRLKNVETNKSFLTTTDFYKWAIHLQQSNPTIKVPEPEIQK